MTLALLATPPVLASSRPLVRHEATRMSMACAYSVWRAAFDEVDRIDRLMSHYRPDSPLSGLNREAARAPVEVEPELFDFIAECLRYSRESEGAFDVTVGPLMGLGIFPGRRTGPGRQRAGGAAPSHRPRPCRPPRRHRTIRFDQAGVELDLGGIAKGYAVDRAVDVLRRRGVSSALVSAGGSTILGLGAPRPTRLGT